MLNKRAHTITELLIASVIIVTLFASCFGTFVLTKTVGASAMAEHVLQRDDNVIILRITKGLKENTEPFGLRSAQSYNIPAINQINFVGTDNATRSYILSGSSIVYTSPTQSPSQNTIYTTPANSSIILRFWNPYAGQPNDDNAALGIYISISQVIDNKPISGSASTYVNLRNIPR